MKTDSCSSAGASVATKAPPELIILLDQREPFWTGVYVFPANNTLQYNTIQYRTVAYRRELAIRFWARKYKKGMVHAIQNVHEALKLVLHVAMLVLMPSQILNLYLR